MILILLVNRSIHPITDSLIAPSIAAMPLWLRCVTIIFDHNVIMYYDHAMQQDPKSTTDKTGIINALWHQHSIKDGNMSHDQDHLWEDATYNVQTLPPDWHPSSPHRPVNYIMKDSIRNARDLLMDRRKMIQKSGNSVEMGCRISFTLGAGLYLMNPALGALLIAGSTAVNVINNRMTKKANRHFDTAEDALIICDDYEHHIHDRQTAIQNLRKTAEHLYHWEKTSRVSTTIVKFAAGEIIPLVGAVISMIDVKDDLTKKRRHTKRTPRTSYVLQDTIDIMEKNLPYKSTPDYTP